MTEHIVVNEVAPTTYGNSIQISSVEGNSQKLDGGAMFGNAPRALWSRWFVSDELGRIELACRSFLVEVAGLRVLLEAGVGAFFDPEMSSRYGISAGGNLLLKNLADIGVSPAQIDFVILSHLHFDHAGGIVGAFGSDLQGQIVFPNAQFIVSDAAWQRAFSPHPRDRASYLSQVLEPLSKSGRVIKVAKGEKFPDALARLGFGYFLSDGHTPGQLHTTIETPESKVVFCGDLIPGVAWINPSITMGYDRYPELLIDEKSWLFGKPQLEKMLLLYTHDPKVVCSGVEKAEKGKMTAVGHLESLKRKVLS